MRIYLFCMILLCSVKFTSAQDIPNLDDLSFYADVMLNATDYKHRLRANEIVQDHIENILKSDQSFSLPIEKIEYLKTVMPPDSSFKIITFNVADNTGKTTDFGYIQKADGQYFPLKSRNSTDDIEYETLGPQDWLSGLYYHIIPFKNENKQYYMLFGFSQPKPNEKRKTIEIFHWDGDQPVFGAELLVEKIEGSRDIKKQRAVYYYSSDVAMSIRDDKEFNAIVIDHLMAVKSRIPGYGGNVNVPDGTYSAYYLQEGSWVYKDKLFEEKDVLGVEDKPEEENKRDLFGNSRKN